jgi:hypothetical protein
MVCEELWQQGRGMTVPGPQVVMMMGILLTHSWLCVERLGGLEGYNHTLLTSAHRVKTDLRERERERERER